MIEIFDFTKAYGEQVLFEDASFNIFAGERIGLVGRNGHGKSTLLKMITGEEEVDGGRKTIPKNYEIGYLRQILKFTEKNVLDEACKGLPQDRKDEVWKVKKILTGLGFKEAELEKEPEIFSGGYQMRIELTKVLVSEPDMLLLDEPTNFLDIISIRWLETFLKKWKGEFIVISHDRNFMDSVVTHIVGIHRAKIRKIKGKTKKYYSTIKKEEEIYEKRRVNDDKKRKQIEGYISSFRAKARRAKSVQSSIKRLDKMESIDKLGNIRELSFSFNCTEFRPPMVMEAKGLCFSYDGKTPYLIKDCSFILERGDKVCIAGANGKGKTTLAKILAGVIEPVKGLVKVNPQVTMAYYEQGNSAKLEDDRTVEDEIFSAHPGKSRTEARTICGNMMFSGDNALKKIAVLSGGERSRVLLAKTLLSPSNLLVMDEPTHHLDMESCEALLEAVKEYEGAAIIVTHDEYFLHKVATKLIIFMDNNIIVFPGNYSEFLEQVGWDKADSIEKIASSDKLGKNKNTNVPVFENKKEERRLRAARRALTKEKLGGFERQIAVLEKGISIAEKAKAFLTETLIKSSEQKDAKGIVQTSKQLKENQDNIDKLYEDLDGALLSLEKAKKELETEA